MRRQFREASHSKASPTVVRPAEAEEVQTQTAPRIRPEVASLSAGVIAVIVVDFLLGLFATLVMVLFFVRKSVWSVDTLLRFGIVFAVAVGAWGAVLCLRKRRRIAWLFQCLPVVSAIFWGPASSESWRRFPPPVGSEGFWLDWTFMVGQPLAFVGLVAYVGWLTRRSGGN